MAGEGRMGHQGLRHGHRITTTALAFQGSRSQPYFINQELTQSIGNLIPHPSKRLTPNFHWSRSWIFKRPMPELDRRKDWTWLLGSIAHCDHVCKILPYKFLDRLRSMMTNIDADLLHDFQGHRVEADGMYPSTFGLEVIAGDQPQHRHSHVANG